MDKFFPLNATVKPGNTGSFIANLIVYVIAAVILGVIGFFIGFVPIIRTVYGIVAGLLGLYILVGIVLSALKCFATK